MDCMAPVDSEDYYVLLGVSPLASFDEVKEAYRKQALVYHPDKNHSANATEQFQKLGTAWETLKDPYRRRDYDLQALSKWRNNLDCRIQRQWRSSKYECAAQSLIRINKARSLRTTIHGQYSERLRNWEEYLKRQWASIKHYQVLVRRYERQMEDQMKDSQDTMLQKFNVAISLSEAKGKQIDDHEAVLAQLMDARRIYLLNLKLAGQATKGRLQYLLEELSNATRSFEATEFAHRRAYLKEALMLLDLERGHTPLFTVIDRRQQSVNHWKALGRVKSSVSSLSRECIAGAWHHDGDWPRVAGEHVCARCNDSAFHVIPGMGAASCPGCGMIVCANCHHDLQMLRDFDGWVRAEDNVGMSLFSLEFEGGSEPVSRRDYSDLR